MATGKSFTEKTAAPGASAGFEYQYYYFLYRLLNLKKGQSVGLEIKDDVHTDLQNDVQLLFQLKHTIQKQANNSPIALSELDSDLWKTLHNWASVIVDPVDKRALEQDQIDFVKRTEFHLVTNKSKSKTNSLTGLIEKYQETTEKNDLTTLVTYLKALKAKTSDKEIKGYIKKVLSLAPTVLSNFLQRIYLELEETEIIEKIKVSIEEKFVDADRVEQVYDRLNSNIRDDNFIKISNGETTVIKCEDFLTRYSKIFSDSRNKKLSLPLFIPVLPDDLLSQAFIKQLLVIEDISIEDDDLITEYSTSRMRIARCLEQWLQKGEIVNDEIEAFNDEVKLLWRNQHRGAFKNCAAEKINDIALDILKHLRGLKFKLGEDELHLDYSNGELYLLSDERKIGWHKDWAII